MLKNAQKANLDGFNSSLTTPTPTPIITKLKRSPKKYNKLKNIPVEK